MRKPDGFILSRGAHCLLTGASSGIGRALAVELASRQVRLAVSARRVALLAELADEIVARGGIRPAILPADLSRRGEATALADKALDRLGHVDIVVSNAAFASSELAAPQWAGADGDAYRQVFETNLWSPLALIGALVPPMRMRGSGAVVTVTSMGKFIPLPLVGHYNATKAALAAATETLRMELRGSGVHVLEVVPGMIRTPMLEELRQVPGTERGIRWGPKGSPQALARLSVRGLAAGRSRVLYPRVGAMIHLVPALGRLVAATSRPDLDQQGPIVPVATRGAMVPARSLPAGEGLGHLGPEEGSPVPRPPSRQSSSRG